MADESKGECVGCGFLSWRRRGDLSSPYFRAERDDRQSGVCPISKAVSNTPYCFLGVRLISEYDVAVEAGATKPEAFEEVVRKDRECEKYFRYTEGSDPKGHAEVMRIVNLEDAEAIVRGAEQEREDRQLLTQMAHESLEAERTRNWQEDQEAKRLAEQKDRDTEQRSKQLERDEILTKANDQLQRERDEKLVEINHSKSVRLAL